MDRSNRNRDRGGQNNRGRGSHDRGGRGNFNSGGGRGSYGNRGATQSRGGSRGGYMGSSSNRDNYTSGNQGGRSGFTGANANSISNNNNGMAPGRERASRWGDSNNSQVTQLQPSQHQPTFVSQPPVQMPNMSNPPPGYPSSYGFQAPQPNNNYRGGF